VSTAELPAKVSRSKFVRIAYITWLNITLLNKRGSNFTGVPKRIQGPIKASAGPGAVAKLGAPDA